MSEENFAHFSGGCLTILQRKRHWHRGTNPEVTFLQMREKLAAESGRQHPSYGNENDPDSDRDGTFSQGKTECRIVCAVQQADDDGFGLLHVFREEHGG